MNPPNLPTRTPRSVKSPYAPLINFPDPSRSPSSPRSISANHAATNHPLLPLHRHARPAHHRPRRRGQRPGKQRPYLFPPTLSPRRPPDPIRIAADGTATTRILTVDGWIEAVSKRGSDVFYEHQIKVRTESWGGHIAHLWSTYETRTTPEGKPLDRGINSIQAVFDGHQWQVIEIIWQAETPAAPVPERYLP